MSARTNARKLHILFVSEFFYPRKAGGEVWAWQLCKELARRGHDVTVITCRYGGLPEEETASGVRILRPVLTADNRPVRRIATMRLARYVKEYVRRNKEIIDIIHVPAYTMNVAISRIAKRNGIPCITSVHSYFGDQWKQVSIFWPFLRWLERRVLAADESSLIHVVASSTKREIERLGKRDVKVIPNFIDGKAFAAAHRRTKRDVIRKKYGVRGKFLLYVGSLIAIKNLEETIRQLAASGEELTFVIAGDGPLRQRLERLAAGAPRRCAIRLIGPVDEQEKLSLVASCDAVILLSASEQFPYLILEALAYNRGIIATKVGAIPDVAPRAWLVGDTGEVPRLVKRVHDNPSAINARVLREYDTKAVVDRFVDEYERLRRGR